MVEAAIDGRESLVAEDVVSKGMARALRPFEHTSFCAQNFGVSASADYMGGAARPIAVLLDRSVASEASSEATFVATATSQLSILARLTVRLLLSPLSPPPWLLYRFRPVL